MNQLSVIVIIDDFTVLYTKKVTGSFPVAQMVKILPAMQGTQV